MRRSAFVMKSAAAFAALGMTLGSTATAATTSFQAVDPLVAVSVFGNAQSSAVLPTAGSQAAAATAVAGPGAPSGVLIPASSAATASVGQGAEPYYGDGSGMGVLPILAGLVLIVVIAAVLLKNDDDDGEIVLPISP